MTSQFLPGTCLNDDANKSINRISPAVKYCAVEKKEKKKLPYRLNPGASIAERNDKVGEGGNEPTIEPYSVNTSSSIVAPAAPAGPSSGPLRVNDVMALLLYPRPIPLATLFCRETVKKEEGKKKKTH